LFASEWLPGSQSVMDVAILLIWAVSCPISVKN
jgi:hypothetical protein